ncbi:MAG: efflux RND transporter permease subunit [Acidobacteriota bacterium]
MSLPEFAVRRPIAILMITLAVGTFGFLAARHLPIDLLPDLSYPTLTIQTVYEDAAPVSVEQFVTEPVEEVVGVLSGVREMRSVSRPGLSGVILEFDWNEDMDFAAADVREKLGLARLPREAELPRVLRFDPSLDPILRIAFSGDRPLDEIRQLADRWLKPRLESIPGVAAVKVVGGLEPEVVVEVGEDRLAALQLTQRELLEALQSENVNQPGGTLKDLNAVYLIRTLHEFNDLGQLRKTVVRATPGGLVRVEDVATVTRGHRDRQEITRAGGREVVELALHREGSANTVAVAAEIRKKVDLLRRHLAADLGLTILDDQSRFVAVAVGQVWSAALLGGLLAVFVLYFFLRDLASTTIIALAIPVSVTAAFLPLHQAGVTLNIMSLGGLALGMGMLVDNSIVVLEAIDRHRRAGLARSAAAILGTREVQGAVTAATLTTVSVFFPIIFVVGIAGQLFYDLAITVCSSLVASLLVALTLIPALAALDLPSAQPSASPTLSPWDRDAVDPRAWKTLTEGMWEWIRRGLPAFEVMPGRTATILGLTILLPFRAAALFLLPLVWALQSLADRLFPVFGDLRFGSLTMPPLGNGWHWFSRLLTVYLLPLRLVLLALAAALSGGWFVMSRVIHMVFAPLARLVQVSSRAYTGSLRSALHLRWLLLPAAFALFGLSLALIPLLGTNLVPDLSQGEFAFELRLPEGTPLEATDDIVRRVEAALLNEPLFERVFSRVGSLPSTASGRRTLGENLAQIGFVLPERSSEEAEARAIQRVREVLARFSNVEAELVRPSVLSVKAPVSVHVFATGLADLDSAAGRVEEALNHLPDVTDVANSSEPGHPEVRIALDRERAARLGVTPAAVGESLRRKIRGEVIGKFRDGEERINIRLRASRSSERTVQDVAALRVHLPGGESIPISALAHVDIGRGPAAIRRVGGARMAEVTARVAGTDLGRTLDQVQAALPGLDLPAGVRVEMAGQDREMEVSFRSLELMLALAVFLVYVVMAAQFESLIHPLVILISIPLGAMGVVGALVATRRPVSVLVLIGAVMLAGIVVNNAIVLVDAINRRRREGEPVDEAITGAGAERLRPILMTTTTTVLALCPMALGFGAGDELRAPLAITVIGGLLASTLLTLYVIPCMYRVFSRGNPEPAAVPRLAREPRPVPFGERL